jgi:hypothetical protein
MRGPRVTYLERLRIPILDLADRRHLIEAIGQLVQLLDAMGEAYGELLGEKLRCAEEGACDEAAGCESAMSNSLSNGTQGSSKNVPVDGFSPNWTIWRRLTPVAGNLA